MGFRLQSYELFRIFSIFGNDKFRKNAKRIRKICNGSLHFYLYLCNRKPDIHAIQASKNDKVYESNINYSNADWRDAGSMHPEDNKRKRK